MPSFELGPELTAEQREFLERNGYIRFRRFASPEEVAEIRADVRRAQERVLEEGLDKIFGVPVTRGVDESGTPFINRLPFTSVYSERLHEFLKEERFEWVRRICGPEYRLGEREKDGVVTYTYRNCEGSRFKQQGWHVDGLRDVFYLRVPKRYLNIGFYLTDSPRAVGGLRVIPGTHRQGWLGFLFGKAHFLDKREDPREVAVEAEAGDLTIHDGRLWHRAAQATAEGDASHRMVMYMPFLKDAPQIKDDRSRTPLYHHLQRVVFR